MNKCKECEFLIENINKYGSSHCYELDIIFKEFPKECLYFKQK